MKLKELKTRSDEELNRLLSDWTEKLRELNFKDANKQLSNVRELRLVKRNIAQVKTLLKERQK